MAVFLNRFAASTYSKLILGLWLLATGAAYGQTDSLGGLASRFGRYQQVALPEKLFLHLDRPLYVTGETMWFKVYAVDGTYGKPLALSKVAYVEVLDKQHRPVLQAKIPLKDAMGQGSFSLPASLASGSYTVRAYTSWMQNFGPEYYFHHPVTVLNTFSASGTVASKDSAAYDVQFFPEGGNLVQGLRSKVGFKVTNHAGKAVPAAGQVLDQNGAVAATFTTLRFGMGNFVFTPAAGRTYTAVVTLPGRQVVRRPLPRVFEQGYVLRLDDTSPDQLTLSVSSTSSQPETIFLLGHARQQLLVAARAQTAGGSTTFTIDKKLLLDGVSHFTVFNQEQKPLGERLYFQSLRQRLTLTARPDNPTYPTRAKVSVQVAAASPTTQPATANLSVAVYRLDSLATAPLADINSYLWLTADLKGTVEHPEYYLATASAEAAQAADNLMLTQGWSRFRWENVLSAATPAFSYLPELNGPLLRGRLTNPITRQPATGVVTYLSSPSRLTRLNSTRSDATGLVQFEMDEFYGTRELVLQTNPQQDSTSRLEVFSPFSSAYSTVRAAPFATLARFQPDYTKRHFQTQVQTIYAPKDQLRPLVRPVDSLAFYGKPSEMYLLDKYTRFKVLEEVMREYVPGVVVRIRKDGFHFLVLDKTNKTLLTENPMVLLDGVPVFNINKIMAMDPLKIQKLEVVDARYMHGWPMYNGIVSYTTYKGNLEGFPLDARVLVQRYEGLQQQREFYSPRYDTPDARRSRLPDLRNLLYWNPNVTTTGTAATPLEFFTGDQAGRYVVVLQGLSDTGLAGSTSFTFEVKPAL